jgi:hypothetical protein
MPDLIRHPGIALDSAEGCAWRLENRHCVPSFRRNDKPGVFNRRINRLRLSGGRLAVTSLPLLLRLSGRLATAFVFYNCLDLDGSAVEPGIFYGLVHLVGYPVLHLEKGELPLQIDLADLV